MSLQWVGWVEKCGTKSECVMSDQDLVEEGVRCEIWR